MEMKKRSVRETSMAALPTVWEREEHLKNYEMIPIGDIVWSGGGAFDWPEPVLVTEENQKTISLYWNSAYFDNKDDAERHAWRCHADYGNYLMSVWQR